jgi:hypothetical protein
MADTPRTLAEIEFALEWDRDYALSLQVERDRLRAWIGEKQVFDLTDHEEPLMGGAVAFVVENGTLISNSMTVGVANRTAIDSR